MRILIIGTPRSGTSTLMRALSSSTGYKQYIEPWNPTIKQEMLPYPYDWNDDIVVKTIVWDIPENYCQYESNSVFYKELVKDFDRVVILGRKSREDLLFSFAYQRNLDELHNYTRPPGSWLFPYHLDPRKINLEPYRKEVERVCNSLLEVSKDLDIPITWYEDLYCDNVDYINQFLDNLNIDLDRQEFFERVNTSNRQRKSIVSPI